MLNRITPKSHDKCCCSGQVKRNIVCPMLVHGKIIAVAITKRERQTRVNDGRCALKNNNFVRNKKIKMTSEIVLVINQLVCNVAGKCDLKTRKIVKSATNIINPNKTINIVASVMSYVTGFFISSKLTVSVEIAIIGRSVNKFKNNNCMGSMGG